IIRGRVLDSEGLPMPGASVRIKGTAIATSTDADGRFSLNNAPDNNPVIVVTSIGYKTVEVRPGGADLTVILEMDQSNLNEVLVVGYGLNTKRNLTNAVSRLDAGDVSQRNVSSANQLMQGQIAGVNMTVSNGTPGGASRVSIRGVSSING